MSGVPIRKPGYSVEHQSWFIPLTQGVIALVDADMVPALGQHNWYARCESGHWYARRNEPRSANVRRQLFMHRIILSAPDDRMVDHEKHRPLAERVIDNRRANLRECTRAQNAMNMEPRAGGSSRYKGVGRWSHDKRKWVARIRADGKARHLGIFTDEVAAARAYDAAALQCFGVFAVLNFPSGEGDKKYG